MYWKNHYLFIGIINIFCVNVKGFPDNSFNVTDNQTDTSQFYTWTEISDKNERNNNSSREHNNLNNITTYENVNDKIILEHDENSSSIENLNSTNVWYTQDSFEYLSDNSDYESSSFTSSSSSIENSNESTAGEQLIENFNNTNTNFDYESSSVPPESVEARNIIKKSAESLVKHFFYHILDQENIPIRKPSMGKNSKELLLQTSTEHLTNNFDSNSYNNLNKSPTTAESYTVLQKPYTTTSNNPDQYEQYDHLSSHSGSESSENSSDNNDGNNQHQESHEKLNFLKVTTYEPHHQRLPIKSPAPPNPAYSTYTTIGSLIESTLINPNTRQPISTTTTTTTPTPPSLTIKSTITTEKPLVTRDTNLLKQLKMQFVMDCAFRDRLKQYGIRPNQISKINPQLLAHLLSQNGGGSGGFVNYPFNSIDRISLSNSAIRTGHRPGHNRPLTTALGAATAAALTSLAQQSTIYRPPPPRRQKKAKVKQVYVNPPPIDEITDVFESIYQYLEDAFTSTVVEKTKHKTNNIFNDVYHINQFTNPPFQPTKRFLKQQHQQNRRPQLDQQQTIKRKPQLFHRTKRTTLNPYDRSTRPVSNGINKKNYLTTNIHVTSEYNGASPTSSLEALGNKKKGQSSNDYDEDDDYYLDDISLDGLNVEDDDDDDDDDEDDDDDDADVSSESGEDDDYPIPTDKTKAKRKLSKISNSQQINHDDYDDDYSYDDRDVKPLRKLPHRPDNEDDDYDDGDDDGVGGGGYFGNFFGNIFESISDYFSSYSPFRMFSVFGGAYSKKKEADEARSTTPRIELRRPKQPSFISSELENDDGNNNIFNNNWINSFYGSNEDLAYTTPMTPTYTTTEASSDFWNWFGGSGEESIAETPTAITKPTDAAGAGDSESSDESENNGWFFGLFDGGSTTTTTTNSPATTRRPFLTVANPLQNPQAWLGILASHLATTTTTAKPQITGVNGGNDTLSTKRMLYTNYQLWRLKPSTEAHLTFLQHYRSTPEGAKLQWWKGPTLRGPTDICIPPLVLQDVKESLQYEDIPYEVIIWDMEKAILYENPQIPKRERIELIKTQGHPMCWYRYHRYDDIIKFMEYFHRKYPKNIELIHIGRSYEGRPLIIAKIFNTDKLMEPRQRRLQPKRSSIFIEAGSHGREWIGPATATWLFKTLIQTIDRNDTLGESVRSVDWYIMPVLNPDGYEYSHENDRLWRKTRSKHTEHAASLFDTALNWIRKDQINKDSNCFGTDSNRNWNYDWNGNGASKSVCNEFYAGPKAFSEPETRAVSQFLLDNRKEIKLFLSLHSYGQMLSYPTTANGSYESIKSDDLHDMASVGIEALRGSRSSVRYTIDSSNEMLYAHPGSADSFALYQAGIKYAYTIELRDTGTHGFLLPPSYIESTAKDTFEIIKGMIDYI